MHDRSQATRGRKYDSAAKGYYCTLQISRVYYLSEEKENIGIRFTDRATKKARRMLARVKVPVCRATIHSPRLADCLPSPSLTTLFIPPFGTTGLLIIYIRMRQNVPSPKVLQKISRDSGRVLYQILEHCQEEIHSFYFKTFFMVDVRFEVTPNNRCTADDAIR